MEKPPDEPEQNDIIRSRMWDVLRRNPPPLFHELDARKIRGPAHYAHPSIPAAALALNAMSAWPDSAMAEHMRDQAASNILIATKEVLKHGNRRYFVGRELLAACEHTSLDVDDMALGEIAWPGESLIFMLPLGSVRSPSDNDLLYAGYALCPGEPFGAIGGHALAFDVAPAKPSVIFFGQTRTGANFSSTGWLTDTVGSLGLNRYDPGIDPASLLPPELAAELSPQKPSSPAADMAFIARMVGLVIRMGLAMQSAPELVEEGTEVSPRKERKGRVHEAEWSASYLGRAFRIKQSRDGPGERAGMKVHWRSGHYRRQRHGEGLTLSKVIWLQPMLVAAAPDVRIAESGTLNPLPVKQHLEEAGRAARKAAAQDPEVRPG